jgi:CBS domain containing-hemolysin-like protein
MNSIAFFWLFSTFFWTAVMSFYSMQEMACISFNRLRLEWFVRKGSRRAAWIKSMLDHPTSLFGTTLIGVNVALVISSESMRQLFDALGLNPNLSPLIHAPYVLIVGELIPMFAARLFPEHMARLGIPLLWLSSRFLAPVALVFDGLFHFIRTYFLSQRPDLPPPHLQRDELKDLLELQTRGYIGKGPTPLDSIVSRMFSLRDTLISQLMVPASQFPHLSSSYICGPSRDLVKKSGVDIALVRNRMDKVIGYVTGFDLVAASESASVGSVCRTSTFVGASASATDVVAQLKKERSTLAFVVGSQGEIVGVVTLDDLLVEFTRDSRLYDSLFHVDKNMNGDALLHEFCRRYRIVLPPTRTTTFAALVEELLGRRPAVNDTVRFGPLELTVKEVGVLGAKTIHVRTAE